MSSIVECKSCGKKLKAPDRLAGKRVRCKCGKAISVPGGGAVLTLADAEAGLGIAPVLSDRTSTHQPRCPSCGSAMAADAVVCLQCGFNMHTGARISVAVDASAASDADAKSHSQSRCQNCRASIAVDAVICVKCGIPVGSRAAGDADAKVAKLSKKKLTSDGILVSPPSELPGKLLKLAIVALLFGGFGWVTYHLVQSVTFDPTAQREADMLKISPRMTVYQVVDAMGRPPKEIQTMRDPATADSVTKFIPKKLFWSGDFMDKHTTEDLRFGFQLIYRYTERELLIFWFDEMGVLISMEKDDPLELLWG